MKTDNDKIKEIQRRILRELAIVIGYISLLILFTILMGWLLLSCQGREIPSETYYMSIVDSLEKENKSLRDTLIQRDFGHPSGIKYRSHRFTDDEIREMRKNDPNHIYRIEGRNILSEDEEFEQRAEEYIEDNYEEIIDKYGH